MLIEDWVLETFPGAVYSTDNLRVNCPYCTDDTGKHMYIRIDSAFPVAHCFRCGTAVNIYNLVAHVEGITYGQAMLRISASLRYKRKRQPKEHLELAGFVPITRATGIEADIVKRYLLSRKVPVTISSKYCGIVPGSWRAWFVFDGFWQGRLLRSGHPKYMSPTLPKLDVLWNAEALVGHKPITICEGIISACNVGSTAVALLAKTATSMQIDRIVTANPKSITIMLDADAIPEEYTLASQLVQHGYAGNISIAKLDFGDPADCEKYVLEEYNLQTLVAAKLTTALRDSTSHKPFYANVDFSDLEALLLH